MKVPAHRKYKSEITKKSKKSKYKKMLGFAKHNKAGIAALGAALGLGALMVTKKEPEISLTKGYYNPETKRYVPSVYQTIKKKC